MTSSTKFFTNKNGISYVRENRHIKDVNRYLLSSMDIWFADWLERYERIDQEEGQ